MEGMSRVPPSLQKMGATGLIVLVLIEVLQSAFAATCLASTANCGETGLPLQQAQPAGNATNSSQQSVWTLQSGSCYYKPLGSRQEVQSLELPGIDILWDATFNNSLQRPMVDMAFEAQTIILTPGTRLWLRHLSLINAILPSEEVVEGGLASPAPLAFNISSSNQTQLVLEDCVVVATCSNLAQFVGWLNKFPGSLQVLDSGRTAVLSFEWSNIKYINTTLCCGNSSAQQALPTARASAATGQQLQSLVQLFGQLLPLYIDLPSYIEVGQGSWPLMVTAASASDGFSLTLAGPRPPASRAVIDLYNVTKFLTLSSSSTVRFQNVVIMNSCAGIFALDLLNLPAVRLVNVYNMWNVIFTRSFRSLRFINTTTLSLESWIVHNLDVMALSTIVGPFFSKYAYFGTQMAARIAPVVPQTDVPSSQINSTAMTYGSIYGVALLSLNSTNMWYKPGEDWTWLTPKAPKPVVWCNPSEASQDTSIKAHSLADTVQVVNSSEELGAAVASLVQSSSNPDAVYWSDQAFPYVIELTQNMSLQEAVGPGLASASALSTNASSNSDGVLDLNVLLSGPIYALTNDGYKPSAVSIDLSNCSTTPCLQLRPGSAHAHLYLINLHLRGLQPQTQAPAGTDLASAGPQALALPLWALHWGQGQQGRESGSTAPPEPQVHLANVSLSLPQAEFRALMQALMLQPDSGRAQALGFTAWQVNSSSPNGDMLRLDSFTMSLGLNGTMVTLLPDVGEGPYLPASSTPSQSPPPSSPSSSVSGGAIAGIVVGCIAGMAILVAVGVFTWRKRARDLDLDLGTQGNAAGSRASAKASSSDGPAFLLASSKDPLRDAELGNGKGPQLPHYNGSGNGSGNGKDHQSDGDSFSLGNRTNPTDPAQNAANVSSGALAGAAAGADGSEGQAHAPQAFNQHSSALGPYEKGSDGTGAAGGPHGSSKPTTALGSSSAGSAATRSGAGIHAEVAKITENLGGSNGPIKKLELLQPIGRGAFGTVYKGRWCNMDVAVKTIVFLNTMADGSEGLEAAAEKHRTEVLREAAVCCSLQHDNVVLTYHYEIAKVATPALSSSAQGTIIQQQQHSGEHKLYLIQELCDCSLSRALAHGLYHWPDSSVRLTCLLPTLSDIVEGLAYLHSLNIVHGDVKTSNVVLKLTRKASDDVVVCKLTDFGLCEMLAPDKTHVSNYGKGTPYYVAPEVMIQQQVTKASDIYSFGVLAWSLMWKQEPFVVQNGRHQHHPNFPHLPSSTPPELQRLVQACLQPNPDDRPTAVQARQMLWAMASAPWYPACLQQERDAGTAMHSLVTASQAQTPGERCPLPVRSQPPGDDLVPAPAGAATTKDADTPTPPSDAGARTSRLKPSAGESTRAKTASSFGAEELRNIDQCNWVEIPHVCSASTRASMTQYMMESGLFTTVSHGGISARLPAHPEAE